MYGQALDRFRRGRTDEARTLLERLIASDGADPETLTLLASCYFRMGDYRRTEKLQREAVDKDPYRARFHYNLALAYERQGKLEDAIYACRNALHLQPDFPLARDKLWELEETASGVPRRRQVADTAKAASLSKSKATATSKAAGGAPGMPAGVGRILKILVIVAAIALIVSLLAAVIGFFFAAEIDLPGWLSGICSSVGLRRFSGCG